MQVFCVYCGKEVLDTTVMCCSELHHEVYENKEEDTDDTEVSHSHLNVLHESCNSSRSKVSERNSAM